MRELRLGPAVKPPLRGVNLRDLGFVGTVSEEARIEIKANEVRAGLVLRTAHKHWFGG